MSPMSEAQAPRACRWHLSSHPSAASPASKPSLQLFSSAFSQEQSYPKTQHHTPYGSTPLLKGSAGLTFSIETYQCKDAL